MKNLKGLKFGKLTVIEPTGKRVRRSFVWLCACQCGNEIEVSSRKLHPSTKLSCGCSGFYKDFTGIVVDKLTVVKQVGTGSTNKKYPLWECLCVCGNKVTRSHESLLYSKSSRHCGCLRGYNTSYFHRGVSEVVQNKLSGITALSTRYSHYRRAALLRGYSWELSPTQFKVIVDQNCFYCGSLPSNRVVVGSSEYKYNGIDRVDNNRGYTTINVVPCCKSCNSAKMSLPIDRFVKMISAIYNNFVVSGKHLEVVSA